MKFLERKYLLPSNSKTLALCDSPARQPGNLLRLRSFILQKKGSLPWPGLCQSHVLRFTVIAQLHSALACFRWNVFNPLRAALVRACDKGSSLALFPWLVPIGAAHLWAVLTSQHEL